MRIALAQIVTLPSVHLPCLSPHPEFMHADRHRARPSVGGDVALSVRLGWTLNIDLLALHARPTSPQVLTAVSLRPPSGANVSVTTTRSPLADADTAWAPAPGDAYTSQLGGLPFPGTPSPARALGVGTLGVGPAVCASAEEYDRLRRGSDDSPGESQKHITTQIASSTLICLARTSHDPSGLYHKLKLSRPDAWRLEHTTLPSPTFRFAARVAAGNWRRSWRDPCRRSPKISHGYIRAATPPRHLVRLLSISEFGLQLVRMAASYETSGWCAIGCSGEVQRARALELSALSYGEQIARKGSFSRAPNVLPDTASRSAESVPTSELASAGAFHHPSCADKASPRTADKRAAAHIGRLSHSREAPPGPLTFPDFPSSVPGSRRPTPARLAPAALKGTHPLLFRISLVRSGLPPSRDSEHRRPHTPTTHRRRRTRLRSADAIVARARTSRPEHSAFDASSPPGAPTCDRKLGLAYSRTHSRGWMRRCVRKADSDSDRLRLGTISADDWAGHHITLEESFEITVSSNAIECQRACLICHLPFATIMAQASNAENIQLGVAEGRKMVTPVVQNLRNFKSWRNGATENRSVTITPPRLTRRTSEYRYLRGALCLPELSSQNVQVQDALWTRAPGYPRQIPLQMTGSEHRFRGSEPTRALLSAPNVQVATSVARYITAHNAFGVDSYSLVLSSLSALALPPENRHIRFATGAATAREVWRAGGQGRGMRRACLTRRVNPPRRTSHVALAHPPRATARRPSRDPASASRQPEVQVADGRQGLAGDGAAREHASDSDSSGHAYTRHPSVRAPPIIARRRMGYFSASAGTEHSTSLLGTVSICTHTVLAGRSRQQQARSMSAAVLHKRARTRQVATVTVLHAPSLPGAYTTSEGLRMSFGRMVDRRRRSSELANACACTVRIAVWCKSIVIDVACATAAPHACSTWSTRPSLREFSRFALCDESAGAACVSAAGARARGLRSLR
ncbi:hypothetical protein LXA43DRAFT_1082559 [Ganoderma leucocontextum]|nr:hypothetical protein LXA43DRAFT_1082559 [Ganoderma leucocontextum]